MVVYHIILITFIVELDGCLAVVGWVDVYTVIEDMGGGVGGVDIGNEGRV